MNNNLTYHREGDYLIPDVVPPASPKIGIWGERRRQFLMKHKKPIYTGIHCRRPQVHGHGDADGAAAARAYRPHRRP